MSQRQSRRLTTTLTARSRFCALDDESEAAAGPGGRPHAQYKGHEDLRTLRVQLLRRQFVQVLA